MFKSILVALLITGCGGSSFEPAPEQHTGGQAPTVEATGGQTFALTAATGGQASTGGSSAATGGQASTGGSSAATGGQASTGGSSAATGGQASTGGSSAANDNGCPVYLATRAFCGGTVNSDQLMLCLGAVCSGLVTLPALTTCLTKADLCT